MITAGHTAIVLCKWTAITPVSAGAHLGRSQTFYLFVYRHDRINQSGCDDQTYDNIFKHDQPPSRRGIEPHPLNEEMSDTFVHAAFEVEHLGAAVEVAYNGPEK